MVEEAGSWEWTWAGLYVLHVMFTALRVERLEETVPDRSPAWPLLLTLVAASGGSAVASVFALDPTALLGPIRTPHAVLVPVVVWVVTYVVPVLPYVYRRVVLLRWVVVVGKAAFKAMALTAFVDGFAERVTADPLALPKYTRSAPYLWYLPSVVVSATLVASAAGATVRAAAYGVAVVQRSRVPGSPVVGSSSMVQFIVSLTAVYIFRIWTPMPLLFVHAFLAAVIFFQISPSEALWSITKDPPPSPEPREPIMIAPSTGSGGKKRGGGGKKGGGGGGKKGGGGGGGGGGKKGGGRNGKIKRS